MLRENRNQVVNFAATTFTLLVECLPLFFVPVQLLEYLVGKESTGVGSRHLLQHSALLLLNQHWMDGQLTSDPQVCAALAQSPALLHHCQKAGVRKFIE